MQLSQPTKSVSAVISADFSKGYSLPYRDTLIRIQCRKEQTKQDIFERLMLALDYIDNNYLNNPPVKTIAKASCLSKSHFFRLFKQAFVISPYQYILNKKL